MKNIVYTLMVLVGLALIWAVGFYFLCLNHVGVTEIGIAYNSIDGTVSVQPHPGWYRTSMMTRVTCLSVLPMRVTIPSEATIINSKIVRFNPEGAAEFIKRQGFSWDLKTKEENILLGYAYSGQKFSFLDIIEQGTSDPTNSVPVK
jgi:hypothetical protein